MCVKLCKNTIGVTSCNTIFITTLFHKYCSYGIEEVTTPFMSRSKDNGRGKKTEERTVKIDKKRILMSWTCGGSLPPGIEPGSQA